MPKSVPMDATDPNILTLFWSIVPMTMFLLGAAVGLITAYVVDKTRGARGGANATRNREDADPGSIKIDIEESPSTSEIQDSSEDSGRSLLPSTFLWTEATSHFRITYILRINRKSPMNV